MNILFIKHFCVGFMVSEYCPYSVTFTYYVSIRLKLYLDIYA